MVMDKDRLEEIEKRLKATTPGPWDVDGMDAGHSRYTMDFWVTAGDSGDVVCDMVGLQRSGNEKVAQDDGGADAWFISHAPTDVADLLAEVRRLQALALIDSSELKTVREALCVGMSAIGQVYGERQASYKKFYIRILNELTNKIDVLRPLGPDGKHGNRHTEFCGCEDKMTEEIDEVVPGLGEHDWTDIVCQDSHVDFDVCQVPNGEHECLEKYQHEEDHYCACGFLWENAG